jgi:hypothetical protein
MRVTLSTSGKLGVSVLALLGAAACGSSLQSPTSPFLQGSTSSSVAALSNSEVPMFNVTAAGTSTDGQGPCRFNSPTGRFDCQNFRFGNLNFSRTVTFYDANGNVQTAFDATTTASIKTVTSASGSVNKPDGGTATINRNGTMTVTGLAGAETSRTLNGSEQGTINVTGTDRNGVAFSINTSLTDTTTNLVIPVPGGGLRNAEAPPLSGSRTHSTTTTTTRGSDTHTDTLVRTETFDGTTTVQVQLTINGVTQNCTNNLANHTSTCHR